MLPYVILRERLPAICDEHVSDSDLENYVLHKETAQPKKTIEAHLHGAIVCISCIRRLLKFKQFLQTLTDTPFCNVNASETSRMVGSFIVDNGLYEIQLFHLDNDLWIEIKCNGGVYNPGGTLVLMLKDGNILERTLHFKKEYCLFFSRAKP